MEKYNKIELENAPISSGFQSIEKVPKIVIQKPNINLIHFLNLFDQKISIENRKYLFKKDCIEFLFEIEPEIKEKHIKTAQKTNRPVATQSYNLLNNVYLKLLEEWKFLKLKQERKDRIYLTK